MAIGCPSLPASGHKLCDRHLSNLRAAAKERRKRQTQQGLCLNSCGRKAEFSGREFCLICEAGRRTRLSLEPLPQYIRKQIKDGLKLYRFQEAQEFLRLYLRLVSENERRVVSFVYGLIDGKRRNLAQTAAEMGFSRERARQIHDKAMVRIFAVPVEPPVYLIPIKDKLRKYPERLNERLQARRSAMQAMKTGKLIRKPCQKCGAAKADAHHTDYSKPLDVEWLCNPCHKKAHRVELSRLAKAV